MNIAEALQRQCEQRSDTVVLCAPDSRQSPKNRKYTEITFGELHQRIRRLTAALAELGIQRQARCALMVPPSIEFVELTFALFSMGAVPVFIDPGIGLRHLKACLGHAAPEAFIGVTRAQLARVLLGWARPSLKHWVTVGPRLGWGGTTLDRLRSAQTTTAGIVETKPGDVAAILFTSGSTGVPKGAVYTHGNFVAQLGMLQKTFDIQPGEIDLCTFPLFALFGPALGMTSVIPVMDSTRPARVDTNEIVEPIRRFQITNLFGSPALLNRVATTLDSRETSPLRTPDTTISLPSLKRVLSAGAPVSPLILESVAKRLAPEVQIYTPYGATEALPVAVIGSREVLSETRFQTARGAGTCVGRPVAGIDVKIIRISDEPIASWTAVEILPTNEIGEIAVRGPQVTQEYFRRPDLTQLAKIPDQGNAWHRMGDVGYFDEQGRLWFCGRKSQRVITASGTLFTDPVEGIFNTHPAVFRTALVGVGPAGAQRPVLCVELKSQAGLPRPTPSTLKGLTQELLQLGQQFAQTRSVQTILFHPRFPVDIRHNSKIFREKLSVWAARQKSFS